MDVRRHTLLVSDVCDADAAVDDADEAVGGGDVGHDNALRI